MFFLKNTDRTFGSRMLIRISEENMHTRSDEYIGSLTRVIHSFKENYHKDWLYQMLAQYSRPKFDTHDISYVEYLYEMIVQESLFMTIIPTERWAAPDKEWDINKKTLENAGFKISKSNGNSDGFFECGYKRLMQVYLDDEPIKEDMGWIESDEWHGVIEIGYQHLCKSMVSLKIGDSLLRLPYPIQGIEPCAILFDNTNHFIPSIEGLNQ